MKAANLRKDIFLSDIEFSRAYLSLHYPFTEAQANEYAPYLNVGDAHYSVHLSDTDTTYSPQYGLCYNKNLRWTNALKKMWQVGYWNPFLGLFEGLPGGVPMELDEIERRAKEEALYDILPLDLHTDLKLRDAYCYQAALNSGDASWLGNQNFTGYFGKEIENKTYYRLNDAELLELYNRNKAIILYNDSIWENTIADVFTEGFMKVVMGRIKEVIGATEMPTQPDAFTSYPIVLKIV